MVVADSRTMELRPVAGALGAEVRGVDVRELTPELAESLRAALGHHQVLFFRDQALAPAEHRALARVFGEPQPHPAYPTIEGFDELSILEVTPEAPPTIDTWHTDMTFMAHPPLGTVLHAVVVPEAGGDTLFASLGAAFESLSDRMQRLVDGLEAEHSFEWGFRHSLAAPGGRERLAEAVAANPPVRHPVVRRHPETGRAGLFVNRLFTTRILGLRESESRAILDLLCDHIVTPEHTCRFRWAPDSIAIWDNRATQHRPVNDFWPAHRRMQRITIAGDRPR